MKELARTTRLARGKLHPHLVTPQSFCPRRVPHSRRESGLALSPADSGGKRTGWGRLRRLPGGMVAGCEGQRYGASCKMAQRGGCVRRPEGTAGERPDSAESAGGTRCAQATVLAHGLVSRHAGTCVSSPHNYRHAAHRWTGRAPAHTAVPHEATISHATQGSSHLSRQKRPSSLEARVEQTVRCHLSGAACPLQVYLPASMPPPQVTGAPSGPCLDPGKQVQRRRGVKGPHGMNPGLLSLSSGPRVARRRLASGAWLGGGG